MKSELKRKKERQKDIIYKAFDYSDQLSIFLVLVFFFSNGIIPKVMISFTRDNVYPD